MKPYMKTIMESAAAIAAFAIAGSVAATAVAAPVSLQGDQLSSQSLTVEASDVNVSLADSSFKAVPLAYYSRVMVDGDTITGFDVTSSGVPESVTAAVDAALTASGVDLSAKDADGNAYSASNPMVWVAHNLLDSSVSPWAGKLRDFLDSLKNQDGFKNAAGAGSWSVGENPSVATVSGLKPGMYAIVDTTTGGTKQASIVGFNGTGVNGITTLQGTSEGAQAYELGVVEYKIHDVTVSKTITSVSDHGTTGDAVTSLNGADHAVTQIGGDQSIVSMRLDSTVPNWTGYDKYYYALSDSFTEGLKLVDGSFNVTVGGKTLTNNTDYYVQKNTDGFVVYFGTPNTTRSQTDLLTLKAKYPVNAPVVVTYDMKLTGSARQGVENTNSVSVQYSNNPNQWDKPTSVDGNTVTVYTGKLNITKTDMDGNPLTGAHFNLYDKTTDSTRRYVVKLADGQYRLAENGEKGAVTDLATDSAGNLEIQGLSNTADDESDRYVLQETSSPYKTSASLLPSVEFTVHVNPADGSYTVSEVGGDANHMVTVADNVMTIENARNLFEMPKTGSTWLLIMGACALLLLGGGSLLIVSARRKQRN